MYRMYDTVAEYIGVAAAKSRSFTPSTQRYQVLVRFLPLKAGFAGRAGFSG